MKTKNAFLLVVLYAISFSSCEEKMSDETPILLDKNLSPNAKLITDYSFDGSEGDPIELEIARKWVENYQEKNAEGTLAHFFGNEILNQILAQEGCIGIRMYYGLDDSGNRQLLIVGTDSKGNDILPVLSGGRATETGGIVGDASYPCPSYCPGSGTSL